MFIKIVILVHFNICFNYIEPLIFMPSSVRAGMYILVYIHSWYELSYIVYVRMSFTMMNEVLNSQDHNLQTLFITDPGFSYSLCFILFISNSIL